MANSSEEKFEISMSAPWGGFVPAWYEPENNNVFIGNKNQFSKISSVDMRDPNCFKQGPGLAKLANSASVTTLIRGITPIVASDDTAFAIGGNKLYKIKAAEVVTTAYPQTIDKAAVTGEDGESIIVYQGDVYGFYNHSGDEGDCLKLVVATNTMDVDFMSTQPAGAAALNNAPHPSMIVGDKLAFGNGQCVGTYDGTTLDIGTGDAGLDFKTGSEVADLAKTNDWYYIGVNYPSVSGDNSNEAIIYTWNGVATTWENYIVLKGRIGALLSDNGVVYCWYQEENTDGGYKFGYINGSMIQEIESYDGSMPSYYQVTKAKGFLNWISDGKVYSWGTANKKVVSPILFNLMDGGLANVGGLANPFGTLMVASFDGSSAYQLSKASGLDVDSEAYSLVFDVTKGNKHGIIDEILFEIYPMETGARMDVKVLPNLVVANSANVGTISHSADGETKIHKSFYPNTSCRNFKLKYSYANGSASKTVKVRSVKVFGHYLSS